jgi:hypothetical protein
MKNTIWICSLLAFCAAPPLVRGDVIYSVTVDTTPLAAVAGYMAFDLTGGFPLQDNVATITGFSSSSTLATSSTSGDVSGSLIPGPLTLTADQFFNEWLQGATFASGLTTFTLDLTTNLAASAIPDNFSFFLLDSTFTPFDTSDPSGANSLFSIDLTGANTSPQVYTSSFATATVSPAVSSVPEPGSVWLAVSAALAAGCFRGRRRGFHSTETMAIDGRSPANRLLPLIHHDSVDGSGETLRP